MVDLTEGVPEAKNIVAPPSAQAVTDSVANQSDVKTETSTGEQASFTGRGFQAPENERDKFLRETEELKKMQKEALKKERAEVKRLILQSADELTELVTAFKAKHSCNNETALRTLCYSQIIVFLKGK